MSELFNDQIPKLQARNRELAAELESFDRKIEADARRNAYYFYLVDENEHMEREIAKRKGRPYRDEADSDAELPQPPDDME